MKKLLKVILIVLVVFILIGIGGVLFLRRGLEEVGKLSINAVDVSSLSEGTYYGKYDGGRWSNEVIVTIKDHQITSISIVKDVLFPKEEVTKELLNRVLQEQNVDVDVITGATVTCKAYLKAIENALKGD